MCKRRFQLFIVFILLASFAGRLRAQSRFFPQNASVGLQAHYGSILALEPEALYVRDSYTSLFEVTYRLQTDGSKNWHQANNFPQLGIGAFYGNTGSRKYIGHLAGVAPFINFPVVRTKAFRTNFRLSTGVAWIEKPYSVKSNHKNTLLGSTFNYYISLMLENEVRLSKQVSLLAGASFTHLSNSDIVLPNFGLNVPDMSVGLRWAKSEPVFQKHSLPARSPKPDWRLFASFGAKQTPWVGSPRYFLPVLNAEIAKPLGAAGNWGGGVVILYDASLTSDPSGHRLSKNKIDNVQAGVHVFYERLLGRLTIPIQFGAYVLHPDKGNSLFQVLGIRYRLRRHWSLGFNLKTHLRQVDNTNAGVGYHF